MKSSILVLLAAGLGALASSTVPTVAGADFINGAAISSLVSLEMGDPTQLEFASVELMNVYKENVFRQNPEVEWCGLMSESFSELQMQEQHELQSLQHDITLEERRERGLYIHYYRYFVIP
ncbi:hypothetical protein F4810DRAFT_713302 [Camillea tinctor]|nr:hypothetical protein F4810DRAFT_713302 [Camillea tinctor]